MYEYTRPVHYYETDKMGMVHHSNYIRWMEEARTFYFNDAGLAYSATERLGIMSPVTDLSAVYKFPVSYGETFTVRLKVTKYTGTRFRVSYTIVNENSAVLCEAETGHAFVDKDLKPISMKRAAPERHELIMQCMEKESQTS